jgi:uncharacterized protein GlcG (DUF336 family)
MSIPISGFRTDHSELARDYFSTKEDFMQTKNSMLLAAAVATAVATASGTLSAQTPASAVISEHSISLNAAIELATAALAKCRADGYKVTITVLNRHARVALVLSDDGANPHTIENSLRKAYTSFTTKAPSVDMQKRTQPGLAGFMLLDKITAIEGALPIFAGSEIVGSVGISGAPGGEKDAACAKVGIDKIAAGLGG